MQHLVGRTTWRADFIGALHLVGQAAMRLPLMVSDPVLCGAAALELYTGGLWQADTIELRHTDPRLLTAELFAAGFRWIARPERLGHGLWHPDLCIGIDIIEADPPSVITVAIDSAASASIKIISIEDLIIEEVADNLTAGRSSDETAMRVRALVGLGHAGIAGPFRAAYLERRLAWETGGEVRFEPLSSARSSEGDPGPRVIPLRQMHALITHWRRKFGFACVDACV